MAKSSVRREVLFKNADNLAVWLSIEKGSEGASHAERRSLLNAEIQAVCNDHVSTLDDTMHKKIPRPNPTPRVFIEQGNDLSQILWLKWES
jgi:hypothetical protein